MTIAFGKKFEPPRPGSWEIDLTHFPRPMSRFHESVFLKEFPRGFSEGTRMYGLLLDRLEGASIHGFMYSAPRPVGAPLDAKGPPPKLLFKLLTKLHPEVRRRIRTAKEAIATRSWLRDLEHWDREMKPRAIAENLAVQHVDVASLDQKGLEAHIAAALENAKNAVYRHGRFTMTACVPVGDFLAHANEWTGAPVHELLRTVKGYSAVSSGVAHAELRALVTALRADPKGGALLDGGSATEVLAALRAAEGAVGLAARAWLDQVSYRIVTGYDVCDKFGLELPESLVGAVRAAVNAPEARDGRKAAELDGAALRERVPAAHRETFDTLLGDARAVYRLRDERDHYNDGWSTGLMRRAMLEAGRRIADAGRISSPELVVDADADELLALLRGSGGPSNDELRARMEWRTTADPSKAPERLGIPPSPPPPPEWLPRDAARLSRAINIFLFGLFQSGDREGTKEVMRGIPVSPGVYEGPAKLVLSSEDFGTVKQGDILIARSTSPYFNVLLPLLGGIVTDRGGSLSHAAIVAREYGIPGVVGTKTATTTVKSGQRVRVDGDVGEVTVISAS